jgi:hypothetical protein
MPYQIIRLSAGGGAAIAWLVLGQFLAFCSRNPARGISLLLSRYARGTMPRFALSLS